MLNSKNCLRCGKSFKITKNMNENVVYCKKCSRSSRSTWGGEWNECQCYLSKEKDGNCKEIPMYGEPYCGKHMNLPSSYVYSADCCSFCDFNVVYMSDGSCFGIRGDTIIEEENFENQ